MIGVCRSVFWIDVDCLGKIGDGALVVVLMRVGEAGVDKYLRGAGIEPDRCIEIRGSACAVIFISVRTGALPLRAAHLEGSTAISVVGVIFMMLGCRAFVV